MYACFLQADTVETGGGREFIKLHAWSTARFFLSTPPLFREKREERKTRKKEKNKRFCFFGGGAAHIMQTPWPLAHAWEKWRKGGDEMRRILVATVPNNYCSTSTRTLLLLQYSSTRTVKPAGGRRGGEGETRTSFPFYLYLYIYDYLPLPLYCIWVFQFRIVFVYEYRYHYIEFAGFFISFGGVVAWGGWPWHGFNMFTCLPVRYEYLLLVPLHLCTFAPCLHTVVPKNELLSMTMSPPDGLVGELPYTKKKEKKKKKKRNNCKLR